MGFAIRGERNNPPLAQGATVRFASIAFVQAQAFGLPFAFADANAINRFQQLAEISAVGCTQSEIERMAIRGNDQVAFPPFKAVLA
jgi:hypothetical protein